MLIKFQSLTSILRSVQTGALVLAALAGAASVHAGEEYSRQSNKDKNVIQQAPPAESKFYLTLSGGGEFEAYRLTKEITDGNAIFPGTSYVPALAGNTYSAHIHSANFASIFDPVINARTEIGYQILPYLSVFAGFTYSHANGHEKRVGYVNDDGSVFGFPQKYDLYASMGHYQAYAGRAGLKLNTPRYIIDLLHLPKAVSSYATISAGGKYLEEQQVSFYSGTRPRFVDTAYGTLYDNSWVLTVEGALGYEARLTRNFSVILESGYGYDTAPDRGHLNGVTGVNAGGDRFYSNVSLGGKVRF